MKRKLLVLLLSCLLLYGCGIEGPWMNAEKYEIDILKEAFDGKLQSGALSEEQQQALKALRAGIEELKRLVTSHEVTLGDFNVVGEGYTFDYKLDGVSYILRINKNGTMEHEEVK